MLEDKCNNRHYYHARKESYQEPFSRLLRSLQEETEEEIVIGISFGRTIRAMVESARGYWGEKSGGNGTAKFKFVPLMGELSVLQPADPSQLRANSASTLAADLALTFSGTNIGQLTLPTPAFVPRLFMQGLEGDALAERVRTAQEFVQSIPESKQIFGSSIKDSERDKDCLLARMKIMITSVGGPLSAGKGGWLETRGPTISTEEHEKLKKATCGDLCGHFLTRDPGADEELVGRINDRVFGPSPGDFENCNKATRGEKVPGNDTALGVILVASTAEKAEAVLAALNRGCVSTLIVDQELAEKIVELEPEIMEFQS